MERNDNAQDSKNEKKAPKTYILQVRKFLKQWYEENHTGEPDYSLDQNTVINLVYFNYAKANKLKVKASKETKKLLAGMDENHSKKVSSTKFNKSNKSTDEDAENHLSEKARRKCTKCGKWGTHTADEPLDVLGVMDTIVAHYQKLDDFGKWCISKSI